MTPDALVASIAEPVPEPVAEQVPQKGVAAPSLFPSIPPGERPTRGNTRKRTRWLRAGLRCLGIVVVAGIALALAGYGGLLLWVHSAMQAALPALDGDLHVPGLSAPVTVRRDGHGVPHLQAATLDDLLVAQGYVTAQDRLWQMDLLRRNAAGELAEVLGSSMIDHDRMQRVLGFRKVAERVYAGLAPESRHRYDQYALGVNRYIEQHRANLPAEFRLLGYRPKPWLGVDSLVVGMNLVESLDTHWYAKMSHEWVAARLHDPRLESDLYPVGSWRDHPPSAELDNSQPRPVDSVGPDEDDNNLSENRIHDPLDARYRSFNEQQANGQPATGSATAMTSGEDTLALRRDLGLPDCPGCAPGSNNWAIGGKHTAGGLPLLSNDMHLGLTVPNIWYMADLKSAGFHAAGVTLPGMPLVIAGHNDHVAWGFTALYADVQDLYVETLDGKGNYQAADGSWQPLARDRETIHVRWGRDVTVDVQSTGHGPLLNPTFRNESRPIALKWTLYDPTLDSIPLYELNTAANWREFSAALGAWCWPTQNAMYSDDQGHIAYHAIGRVPNRPGGLTESPIAKAAGGNPSMGSVDHEWRGYIPFDRLPSVVDPPSGLLATANSRVTPDNTVAPVTLEWVEPYRTERIYKALQGRDKLTPADMLALQTDVYSEVDQELGHRFAYAIDRTIPAQATGADARLSQAADLLRSWDGRLTVDSPAASIVTGARRALWPLILKPKLGEQWDRYAWSESDFAEEEIVMHGGIDSQGANWLPPGYKDWDALLTEALRKALTQDRYGHGIPNDLSRWTYGSWHVVDLEHPLFQLLPLIKAWTGTGEHPLSGDTTTVKQVGRDFGPSQRFTMDWSNPDNATENIVLGESGNPASPYFRDQWSAWYNGATFNMPWSENAVAGQTAHTARLVP